MNGEKARNGKLPLYFTFGNHMHWVDMEWLWGYHVLPGSVRDMLHLIKETGAKGNVNFDGIGYEKMAAECPEALAELRAAVKRGDVEPVGCSYGQPYGLFQGGESNIRQFSYGVRSVQRLLGVRPRSFWEEEFYFFPQLPQVLKGCGYTGACLFFQWTWHTPEIPKEPTSLILWEGIDGTRLPALPRNDLNLHQWPEDFEGVLDRVARLSEPGAMDPARRAGPPKGMPPAIVQWLELMPSKDWMCRSEVLLPRLKELIGDKRFEVRARTVGGLIQELLTSPTRKRGTGQDLAGASGSYPGVPVRRYSMDDVWHGMTLGKNGDRHPRTSRDVEEKILGAETLSAVMSLFGRPYASWDIYPAWELDEAWRNLLAAQHHDNHECEGLCGFVGYHQMDQATKLAEEVIGRASWLLRARLGLGAPQSLVLDLLTNPSGDTWKTWVPHPTRDAVLVVRVPAMGYCVPVGGRANTEPPTRIGRTRDRVTLERGRLNCEVDTKAGTIALLGSQGSTWKGSLLSLTFRKAGDSARLGKPRVSEYEGLGGPGVVVEFPHAEGGRLGLSLSLAEDVDAVDVRVVLGGEVGVLADLKPDPGFAGAVQAGFVLDAREFEVRADTPLAVERVQGGPLARRKYPHGDWMTSPQWFEAVERGFTASSFVNVTEPGANRGLLICHNGSQQWFRDDAGIRAVLLASDPWDEGRAQAGQAPYEFRLMPHTGMTDRECVRQAQLFRLREGPLLGDMFAQPVGGGTADGVEADLPPTFGPLEVCDTPNVLAHAFFRESMKSGEHLPNWAGHRMYEESDGACDHPFVIRLVEWNGEPARVRLKLAGKVSLAAKTNLMGEVAIRNPLDSSQSLLIRGVEGENGWLKVRHPVDPPWWGKVNGKVVKFRGKPITWSEVEFEMRPREIATIYADMVMGRKEFRDLDAKRRVWATVHKESGKEAKGQRGNVKKG